MSRGLLLALAGTDAAALSMRCLHSKKITKINAQHSKLHQRLNL